MGGGGAAELQRPSIHTLKSYRHRRGPFGHGSPALLPLSTRCFQSRRAEAGDTLTLTQPQRLIFWNCLYKLTLGCCTLLWIGCFFGGGGILPPIPQGSTACTLFLMGQGLWLIASLNTDGYWAAAAAHILSLRSLVRCLRWLSLLFPVGNIVSRCHSYLLSDDRS